MAAVKNDDNNSVSIVGKWNANQVVSEYIEAGVSVEKDTTTEGSFTFESNSTFTEVEDGDTTTGTYTYNSSTKALNIFHFQQHFLPK